LDKIYFPKQVFYFPFDKIYFPKQVFYFPFDSFYFPNSENPTNHLKVKRRVARTIRIATVVEFKSCPPV
jgi:hypothetical protein